jgi:SAM-dependent methyltransferase
MSSPFAQPHPWDIVAAAYSDEVTPQFEHYAEGALRRAALAPSSRIVDVAAGPGTLSVLAARAGHRAAAIDFSEGMIASLRARLAAEGITSVEALVGDGMALPFPDASFDGGFSMFGLMFFPDRAKGFRELARVLRPGAPCVVSSWVPADRLPFLGFLFSTVAELVPPPPGTPPFKPPLADPSECVAEMAAGGFEEVEVVEVVETMDAPSTSALWASLERTNVLFALRKEALGDAAWNQISRQVLERLTAKFGAGPQTLAMPAYLTVGRRRPA